MMKIIFFLLFIFPISLFAQTEMTVGLGSGLFFFSGNYAVKKSNLFVDYESNTSYIGNPYGAIPGVNFNISQDVHYATKNGILLGVNLGFDYLRSITRLEQINTKAQQSEVFKSTGVFKIYDVSVMPFAGKRFKTKGLVIDVFGGAELAFPFYAEDKADMVNRANYTIQVTHKINVLTTDIRPTIKINAYKGDFGFFAAYSHGISNYVMGQNSGNSEVYSRLLKVGINHRLTKF
ncbi:MAG: hypothetical protein EOP53_19945 [Sphingobacteriales bacterium]|nr:MAG: hypothetical protein EOP53_19945 [Sphingobacteriales bacterium]